MTVIGALFGGMAGALVSTADAAEEPKPPDEPCQKLTGPERTQCERRQKPADEAEREEPPPDTKSEGNDHSDTADPPQA
jgi:hypothetical protein